MTNSYNVGDRVEVILQRKVKHNGEDVVFDDHYAGTILTYRLLTDKETNEEFYLYKVSVDGIGDIVFAKETTLTQFAVLSPHDKCIE